MTDESNALLFPGAPFDCGACASPSLCVMTAKCNSPPPTLDEQQKAIKDRHRVEPRQPYFGLRTADSRGHPSRQ